MNAELAHEGIEMPFDDDPAAIDGPRTVLQATIMCQQLEVLNERGLVSMRACKWDMLSNDNTPCRPSRKRAAGALSAQMHPQVSAAS
jgi:hypothetical protein